MHRGHSPIDARQECVVPVLASACDGSLIAVSRCSLGPCARPSEPDGALGVPVCKGV